MGLNVYALAFKIVLSSKSFEITNNYFGINLLVYCSVFNKRFIETIGNLAYAFINIDRLAYLRK